MKAGDYFDDAMIQEEKRQEKEERALSRIESQGRRTSSLCERI
jgi:hypothetical protein